MGTGTDGARFLFWCMVVLGWPFFAWQLFCFFTERPIPLLGRQYGAGHIETTFPVTGQQNPDAVEIAVWVLALEGIAFLIITVLAYARSGFGRGY